MHPTIRPFQTADEPKLADLYEATVRRWAPALYSADQVEAWAISARDSNRFHSMLTEAQSFVAIDSLNQPLGFTGVDQDGRIASLYVAADSTRMGIGSSLLRHVIDHASKMKLPSLWSEASSLSRELFQRHDFVVENAEYVVLNNVEFKRWIVRQQLNADH